MRTTLTLIALWLLGSSALIFAQPQQSEHFCITKSVLDAGGGTAASTHFQLVSAFGQPSPVGGQSSEHFALFAGFLSPTFAVSPLSPIQDLVVQRMGLTGDVRLAWQSINAAQSYVIYRDSTARFTPAPGNRIAVVTDTMFTDTNALSLPFGRYFYIVTASTDSPPLMRRATAISPPLAREQPTQSATH